MNTLMSALHMLAFKEADQYIKDLHDFWKEKRNHHEFIKHTCQLVCE